MEENQTAPEQVVQSLQKTNQILRQRTIIMAVLMIIGWGLLRSSQIQYAKFVTYFEYITLLEQFEKTADAKGFIEADSLSSLYFIIDTHELYYKMEKSGYKDRGPIVEAIADVKRQRKEFVGQNRTIGIFGMNVPMTPWLFLAPLIILVLFHDFTETIFYRKTLQSKAALLQIEDWEKGPEFFGFHSYAKKEVESRFLQIISSVLITLFMICPLITCILFMMEGFGNHYTNFDEKPADLLLGVDWVCLMVVLIDTILVFYHANIAKCKEGIDLLCGKSGFRNLVLQPKMLPIWSYGAICTATLHGAIFFLFTRRAGLDAIIIYYLAIILSTALFYFSVWKCKRRPQSIFWRVSRFWTLLINFYWVFLILMFVILPSHDFTKDDVMYLLLFFVAISFGAAIIIFPLYLGLSQTRSE